MFFFFFQVLQSTWRMGQRNVMNVKVTHQVFSTGLQNALKFSFSTSQKNQEFSSPFQHDVAYNNNNNKLRCYLSCMGRPACPSPLNCKLLNWWREGSYFFLPPQVKTNLIYPCAAFPWIAQTVYEHFRRQWEIVWTSSPHPV